MNDKLLREKLKIARELVGKAHPFIVTELILRRGDAGLQKIAVARETPTAYTEVWRYK